MARGHWGFCQPGASVLPSPNDGPKPLILHRFRIFTLDQANTLLPTVQRLTSRTKGELDTLQRAAHASDGPDPSEADHEARELLGRWAHSILALGAQPKGVFTVDFRTLDPNVLWCWAPEEHEICHRHFTWESFKDRCRLTGALDTWPGRN